MRFTASWINVNDFCTNKNRKHQAPPSISYGLNPFIVGSREPNVRMRSANFKSRTNSLPIAKDGLGLSSDLAAENQKFPAPLTLAVIQPPFNVSKDNQPSSSRILVQQPARKFNDRSWRECYKFNEILCAHAKCKTAHPFLITKRHKNMPRCKDRLGNSKSDRWN